MRATDELELLQHICQIMINEGGYQQVWVGLAKDDASDVRPVAQANRLQPLPGITTEPKVTTEQQALSRAALRSGRPAVVQNITTDVRYQSWREEAKQQGYAATIALPLLAENQVFGALSLYAAEPNPFDAIAIHLLTQLAGDVSYGIAALRHRHDRHRVVDLVLTKLDGWETLSQLKQHAETQTIPIIICSISAPTHPPFQTTGYVDWGNKPLDESVLLQSLFHATTAREAIGLSQQISPNLLVLDLVLPEGDGFAVVEWLQQHQRLRETPLVIYSGKDLDASERDRLQLGQTEFLQKGRVTIQEFEQRVMQLLQRVTQVTVHSKDSSQTNSHPIDPNQTEG